MDEIQANEVINGRYVLKQSKGRGTFGQVWLAYDRATDEDVAIKFYVALDNKGREEFIQEFRIAAQLHHPNLLVTKDYGEWQGHPYLTMKYCDHGSAADLIGRLTPCEHDEHTIWRFIRDVSAGLAYLHDVTPDPIVHQDIKPDNVLVDTDGTFLITDFGISKRIRNTMSKQSTRALKAGAPAYMGPERFSSTPEPILASDVWSLGASIYEMAEGELPFCGQGGIMMLNGSEIPSLSSGWSKNLNDVMRWCLEKETWNRAKACHVQKIAEAVISAKDEISVEKLIAQIKGKATNSKDSQSNKKKYDPHATRSQINGESKVELNTERKRKDVVSPVLEATSWWRKPIVWGFMTVGILSVIFIMWFALSHLASQPEQNTEMEIVEDSVDVVSDSSKASTVPVDTGVSKPTIVDKQISTTKNKQVSPSPQPKSISIEVKRERTVVTGTLNLGYATWTGNIRNGKPDGKGTMKFNASHRIDTRDSQKRMAEAGERIEGTYINGHLEMGRWYKSDGTTETIMLGE